MTTDTTRLDAFDKHMRPSLDNVLRVYERSYPSDNRVRAVIEATREFAARDAGKGGKA